MARVWSRFWRLRGQAPSWGRRSSLSWQLQGDAQMGCARVRSGSYSSPAKPLAPTGEAPLCGCRDRQRRALGGPQERPERMVAHLGSGRASTVRADRRRTVSGDVRRERQFRFSHAVSIGWVCKPEVAGSIPARSIAKVAANGGFLARRRSSLSHSRPVIGNGLETRHPGR